MHQAVQSEELQTVPGYCSNPRLRESQIHFLWQTVSELAERCESVIVIPLVAGLSVVQTAERFGKWSDTVRIWLRRACKIYGKTLLCFLRRSDHDKSRYSQEPY